MKVTLLAFTQVTPMFDTRAEELGWEGTSARPSELLLEFAGRACYQSWSKPNPATANTDAYLANVAAQNHWSVVEHASVSFYLEDVSRALTHELVRHRHFSYSQLSQRYVNMDDPTIEPVIPPLFRDDTVAEILIFEAWHNALDTYRLLIEHGEQVEGLKRKQIREAARCVLPNMTPTSVVVTGNFRSWLEFLDKRDNPAADAEIKVLARDIRHELEKVAPAIFGIDANVTGTPQPVKPEFLEQP